VKLTFYSSFWQVLYTTSYYIIKYCDVYTNTGTLEFKHVRFDKNHKEINYNNYNRGITNGPRIYNRGMRLNILMSVEERETVGCSNE